MVVKKDSEGVLDYSHSELDGYKESLDALANDLDDEGSDADIRPVALVSAQQTTEECEATGQKTDEW